VFEGLENNTEQDFVMALNVKGPCFTSTQLKASPHVAPGSHLIFFSTTLCAASTVTPNYLLYDTTTGAVEQM
ncbi:hypothetical protein V1505DRAFT_294421, partial [Lipomyces doorenjongii]